MSRVTRASRPWYDRPLPLGSVAGIPLTLSTSWLFITAAMVAFFGPQIHRLLPGISWAGALGVAVLYALILAVSVLLHELAHALAARGAGWKDSSIEITLWGGHTTFEAPNPRPGASLVVSVVGPLVNLALGGICFLLQPTVGTTGVAALLMYMAMYSNLAVGALNLMPGLPLDGGRIVESAVWKATGSQAKGTIAAGWTGRALVVAGAVGAVIWMAKGGGASPFTAVLVVLVLFPLWTGSTAAIRHGKLRLRLTTMSASSLLSPVALLPTQATVAQAEAAGVLRGTVVLSHGPEDGRLLTVLPDAVLGVPAGLRAATPVAQASIAADDSAVVPADADGDALASAALSSASGTVLVVDAAGVCIGAVRREDVIAAIEGRDRKEEIK